MKKRGYLIFLFFFSFIFIKSCKNFREKKELPNIILVTIDALRADHISLYGYPYQTTPHLDEFAKKTVVFEYAYAPIPKTSASIASMMTGLHPFVHKTRPNRDFLKEKFITLAEALKLRGYYNYAIVDNPNLSEKFKFNQGFDDYLQVWEKTEEKRESTPFITKNILKFLSETKSNPFFLWVHYIEPHSPYLPPREFVEKRPEGRVIMEVKEKIIASHRKYIDEKTKEGYFLALYDGAIKYIDSELKKIVDLFFEKQYDKNSLFIISSDHGEELGEYNFFYNHGPLTFNSSVRVPLIFYSPKRKPKRIKYPVSLMDIYPTLLAEAGLSIPYEIQGINLFEGKKNRFLFIKGHLGTWSVVYNNYHLVKVDSPLLNQLNLKKNYLFDIYKDPLERKDISAEKEHIQKEMEKRYIEFFNQYGYLRVDQKDAKPNLSEKELERLRALGYIE